MIQETRTPLAVVVLLLLLPQEKKFVIATEGIVWLGERIARSYLEGKWGVVTRTVCAGARGRYRPVLADPWGVCVA
ncbi:hypothetical protein HQ560_16760 [bacterium]|nr:hypothetical protein [bacterium]